MGALRFFWMTTLIYMGLLLSAGYFVLFANRKVHERWLKTCGYIIAGILGFAASAVFLTGIFISLKK
ncbi:MAG: hypothetical protein PHJ00_04815 [Candidatus Omnitrophica bacterium]|nr:hypothetical protein [Candidatus Omnitrophota bacterium]MDD5654634.1 hypothetical protein [Candidatus Omnitrophota bacterium]